MSKRTMKSTKNFTHISTPSMNVKRSQSDIVFNSKKKNSNKKLQTFPNFILGKKKIDQAYVFMNKSYGLHETNKINYFISLFGLISICFFTLTTIFKLINIRALHLQPINP